MEYQIGALIRKLEDLTEALRNDNPSLKAHSTELAQLSHAAEAFARESNGHLGYVAGIMVEMAQVPAISLLVEWGAFQHIPFEGTISYRKLAGKLDADAALIARLSRVLVSTGVLRQVGDDEVTQTRLSAALSSSGYEALLRADMGDHLLSLAHMKSYFAQYGRREPSGMRDTILAYALGEPSLTVWELMNRNEARVKEFMRAMSAITTSVGGLQGYDFSWVLTGGESEPDRSLIVDVGGGRGHSLEAILESTPGLDLLRCVVQDLPIVIDEATKLAEGELKEARFIAMDFHTNQPVKSALVYLIRRCLHDYGDDDCVNILRNIRGAMSSDSKLLIVDQVMGNPPAAIDAAYDLYMSIIGGKERMRGDFDGIARRAGLEVREVYRGQPDVAVVECVPV